MLIITKKILINLSKKESQMLLLPKLTFHYGRSKSEKIKQKKQVHLKISKSFMNEQIEKRSISNNSSVQNLNNLSSKNLTLLNALTVGLDR